MTKPIEIIKKAYAIIKLFFSYIWVKFFANDIMKDDIWLICEKITEARDNGYHLFAFLRQYHPEISAYYVIKKDSVDYEKIRPYGNIIFANTFKHYLYYICALYNISSQPAGATPEPKSIINKLKKFKRKDQHIVFLQHGIIKDELTHSFDYSVSGYSLFVCSSQREQDFVEKTYKYPKGIVQNLGLCRFDNLLNSNSQRKKIILVMPTFRKWLISKKMPEEASENEKEIFLKSKYYSVFCDLLNNHYLQNYLSSKGYELVFYPHYAMQPYIQCFSQCSSDVVTIADRYHYDVQNLLIQSSCLITDFSSVFFDFAYMEKPEIFFQFDESQYRSTHYKKGYFDYREDGFGPVFYEADQVVAYLINLIENGCRIEEQYRKRIHAFFDHRDNHNCERTYEAIKRL